MSMYASENLKILLADIGLAQTDISAAIRRDDYSNNQERLLRAISWYSRAEQGQCDDEKVIFSYIALNALYGQPRIEADSNEGENAKKDYEEFRQFLGNIIKADKEHILLGFMKNKKEKVKRIMQHQYLWKEYWNTLGSENPPNNQWKDLQNKKRTDVENDLQKKDACKPLSMLFQCFRVLRNQLMHGSAGYGDWYNRSQIKLCADLLLPLVGRLIKIMLDDMLDEKPKCDWGLVNTPPQREPNDRKNKKADFLTDS